MTKEAMIIMALSTTIRAHPVSAFFTLTFLFTWLVWSPWILLSSDGLHLVDSFVISEVSQVAPFNILGLTLGPTFSAILVTGVVDGRAGVRRLLRSVLSPRIGWRWYLITLIGVPLIMVAGALMLPGTINAFDPGALPHPIRYAIMFVIIAIAGGPLLEEIGWRGFALPRLQRTYRPWVAALIVGIAWGLWHVPLFFSTLWDTPHGTFAQFMSFFLLVVTFSFFFAWVKNSTTGLLAPILAHASVDTVATLILVPAFGSPLIRETSLGIGAGLAIASIVGVIVTRGNLGYRREATSAPITPSYSHLAR